MTGYITYLTEEGDRWDAIAYRVYGDVHAYEPIIAANPTVPIRPTLEGGIQLRVPIRAGSSAAATLPPWKRATP